MNLLTVIAIIWTVALLISIWLFSYKPIRYRAVPCCEEDAQDLEQAEESIFQEQNQFLEVFRRNVLRILQQEFVSIQIDEEYEITVELSAQCTFKAHENNSFKRIRNRFGYTVEDFQFALSKPLVAQESNGKSKSIFLYTACKRFIFKATRRREHKNLIEWLPEYLTHLLDYPNSLLPRYLGLYTLEQSDCSDPVFSLGSYNFVMMHNWFYVAQEISPIVKFDFKVYLN